MIQLENNDRAFTQLKLGVNDIISKTGGIQILSLMKSLALLCLFAVIAIASTPKVGERVPEFSLPSADGRTVALKDYAGKKLVLVFYRGYW